MFNNYRNLLLTLLISSY